MLLIEFGGILFWGLVGLFLLLEGAFLYSNKNGESFFLLAVFSGLLYFTVGSWPEFNWKFIAIYPALAILWLPVYWYLELRRKASAIKAKIILADSPKTWTELKEKFGYDTDKLAEELENDKYRIKLSHPAKFDLAANAVFFPVSKFSEVTNKLISIVVVIVSFVKGFVFKRISKCLFLDNCNF